MFEDEGCNVLSECQHPGVRRRLTSANICIRPAGKTEGARECGEPNQQAQATIIAGIKARISSGTRHLSKDPTYMLSPEAVAQGA